MKNLMGYDEKSNGIRWYRLTICSVYFKFIWSVKKMRAGANNNKLWKSFIYICLPFVQDQNDQDQ